MAKQKDKVQSALDEIRMLILGSQVLLGFQFRSVFEPVFEKLPHHTQYLKVIGLGLMTIAIGLLLAPGAYHRIVEEGEDTPEIHRFTTRVAEFALLPFAIGLGIDLFVASERLVSRTLAITFGIFAGLMALFFWYGLEAIHKLKYAPEIKEKQEMEEKQGQESGGTKLTDKIKHVLTETRVVLPGAQALLGFQFIVFLMESFEKLPESSRYIHLASLVLVALTIVLLMTPAAYHRIVENGEMTARFHRFASRVLVAALVPLALGLSGDFFIVVRKVTESTTLALVLSLIMLALFYGLWFGYTAYRRKQSARRREWQADFDGQQAAD
jgi:lysylphosphatidylglycerol synthetase-like protein (DUF2156 family)